MREIKFRAWHQEHGMTMTPVLSTSSYTGKVICTGYDKNLHEITLPLMQYTGLKDKNGVEIYEGDILDCEDFLDESYLMIVKFDGRGRFIAAEQSNDNDFLYLDDLDFFVIGNIHENPELLS